MIVVVVVVVVVVVIVAVFVFVVALVVAVVVDVTVTFLWWWLRWLTSVIVVLTVVIVVHEVGCVWYGGRERERARHDSKRHVMGRNGVARHERNFTAWHDKRHDTANRTRRLGITGQTREPHDEHRAIQPA